MALHDDAHAARRSERGGRGAVPGRERSGHETYDQQRVTAELTARRHKPNPAARPPADGSVALKALRASLARCREPALRARLEAAIANLEATYRPRPQRRPRAPCAAPDPTPRPGRRGSAPLRKSTRTMVPADMLSSAEAADIA